MKRCLTCKTEFDGEIWKTQCLDCYRNFKGQPRIQTMRERKGVLIISHPDCTEDEVNEWIKRKYGSVNDPNNWGAVERGGKFKVWWNCQNCD